MYASGEHPNHNYVAMSMYGGQLHFEINFGDGPLNCTIGYSLNDESQVSTFLSKFLFVHTT